MDSHHLLSACYFFAMQVVIVLIAFNIKGAFSPPHCPLSSATLASSGQNHQQSVWFYEHVFDHQPARLRVLTEKDGAAPLKSNMPRKKREITIVSGTTRDRLAAVESTAMSWSGAMSIAVHVWDEADIPSVYQQAQQLHARMEVLGRCRLDIVVVTEDDPEGFTRNLYPVNGMRNVAWRMATTKLIILLDADFKPSPRMHERLTEDEVAYQELERKATQEHHVFVVPAFELMPSYRPRLHGNSLVGWRSNISIPETKEDLKKKWERGIVDCFHCPYSPAGHEPTNFRKFFDPSITTPYSIPYVEGFEPYLLVGRDSTPKYDERFRGYGKNKISHVYSCAHGHGMHFQVLPNAFVFEIPHPQSHSRTYWEGRATHRIVGLYRRFKTEVQQLKTQRERMALNTSQN
ncbi:unnamed protein product [Calypogeia fissa]